MAASHELLWWRHGGHAEPRTRDVAYRNWNMGKAREVLVARLGRVLLERVEMILLTLELLFLEVAERLTVRTRLVRTTMLGQVVGARESFVAQRADVWSFLCVGAHVPLEVF